jgi:transcriptional regulator with XRE-family HTH domain
MRYITEKEYNQKQSDELYKVREAARLTLSKKKICLNALAKATGLNFNTVKYYFNGCKNPKYKTISRINQYLNGTNSL